MATFKETMRKLWHFLWKEDSVTSWIVNIVLAFIIIKFLIYPGIGLLLGTNLPVVAVISESMEHNANFDSWWQSPAMCGEESVIFANISRCAQSDWYMQKGITKLEFLNFSMHNGFNKGDIILLKGTTYDKINVGDVIVYQSKLAYPIIHRVVAKDDVLQTKGDHNTRQIIDVQLNEKIVTKDQVIGKAWIKIPYLGYVKIWFVDLLQCVTFNGCGFQ